MKKIPVYLMVCLLASLTGRAQHTGKDSVALFIMDRMSDLIGDLQSCSFTLNVAADELDFDHGMVKHYGKSEVYMAGPDKMLVNSWNHKGHREYWYNGVRLTYYSYDENNFGVVNAQPTTMETIDQVNTDYGIDFPAADFFYPTFTDDLVAHSDRIVYLGKALVNDKECFHILATSKEITAQLWITNDAFFLPFKFVLVYNTQEGRPQYEGTFSNWSINPILPAAMFEFLPPHNAALVKLIPKNQN